MVVIKKYLKNIFFGLITWLFPFILSFAFYSKEGILLIDIFLFKSIMIVFSGIIGVSLLILYFKDIKKDYFIEGIIIGFSWLFINILLDILILMPLSGMTYFDYASQIGLRYLIIPIMSISMGLLLRLKL
ncbi:conserved hypothetical protein [Methanococcus vannielii SB]|uniref:Uncharacterized protein n=1 Tax=Methanococcus vannielii (strain ATCC 35089 / DSM 1224 / JCM 13029 / OCM 148 / SB) TaxID=406327 RepID=A6USU5_METVS|nr:hypothetical protein [Methanococcus vannielii]ABR55567.1 conserved hypothetical protein [Methanococcus vannielii SB]